MNDWPVLTEYDQDHLARVALPLGGIGTGTVSLGGRGDLRDWEVMNRPAKGFAPAGNWRASAPFFALHMRVEGGPTVTRCLEGPLEPFQYEGAHGSPGPNHGLPRFRYCRFQAAYPFGQIVLTDPDVPIQVRMGAFNPLVPGDADASGYPCAVLRYQVTNLAGRWLTASVCGSLPNFIGANASDASLDLSETGNRNDFRQGEALQGIAMTSDKVPSDSEFWGTLALAVPRTERVTYRTSWSPDRHWGESLLDFWDDLSDDGLLDERPPLGDRQPMASLGVLMDLEPGESREVTFVLAWHFPNRQTWTPDGSAACECSARERNTIGNYYATRFRDAWHAAEELMCHLPDLEERTLAFVRALCQSDLPQAVQEAALYNLSTLRTQTCFRTPDGHFFAWEGTNDRGGCCHGSCTHVWNYEQATAYLFADLARSMREVEFLYATRDDGHMSFRVHLPLQRATEMGTAAADGQMGCIMKAYRDWQLCGDDAWLARLWPRVKKAIEFCWIPGGWDADQDGVMEGCQHNTMDVEYFGPNPQMGIWYLGALRAAEEMARHLGEDSFADHCRSLFERGSRWIDEHLYNGEYYEHQIRLPQGPIAEGIKLPQSTSRPDSEDYQLGPGCLVDQLVGQFVAHVCGLGYLIQPEHARQALASILRYNRRDSFAGHFNNMRSYVLGDESGLLMADYPRARPRNPFPYYNEVMTGFEYAAAVGMLYEGMEEEGLRCIQAIRHRYDGRKRSPFDEAECGHHYGRAMASWAAVLAWVGFRYSGVTRSMAFRAREGTWFWSNGTAWGTCRQRATADGMEVALQVLHGSLTLRRFELTGVAGFDLEPEIVLDAGDSVTWELSARESTLSGCQQ